MKTFKIIFGILCLLLLCVNVVQLTGKLTPSRAQGFLGHKFTGLEKILKNETHAGYFTDLNLKDIVPLAEYEQAQYILAPTVLEINGRHNNFFIINCSNDQAALTILQSINGRVLTRNNFGIILAIKDEPPAKTQHSLSALSL